MERAPHPVKRPPIARSPGVIPLPNTREAEPLVANPDLARDAAWDLVASRLPPGVWNAVGLPDEIERDVQWFSRFGAQRCGWVGVGFRRSVEYDAKALELGLAVLLGLEALDSDRLGVVVGGRQRRRRVD